jgi:hypothetical protein
MDKEELDIIKNELDMDSLYDILNDILLLLVEWQWVDFVEDPETRCMVATNSTSMGFVTAGLIDFDSRFVERFIFVYNVIRMFVYTGKLNSKKIKFKHIKKVLDFYLDFLVDIEEILCPSTDELMYGLIKNETWMIPEHLCHSLQQRLRKLIRIYSFVINNI